MPVVKVHLAEIFQYLIGKSRPVVEGEAVFDANHVLLCEVESVDERRVFGLCLQSSALKSLPHEIKLELGSPGTAVSKWNCKCSCKAGQSGYCKHVVAVLLYVNRHEVLNELSCTDVKQVWGKEKKNVEAVYAAERAVDFWHFQKKHKYEFKSNKEVEEENLKLLLECKPSSAISVFHKNAATVKTQRCLTSVENSKEGNMCSESSEKSPQIKLVQELMKTSQSMTTVHVDEMWYPQATCCKQVLSDLERDDILEALMCKQGSKEWKEFRKLRLTGTSIYSMYTFKKKSFEEKAKSLFWPKGFSNKYVEHGKRYEKKASESFQNKYPEVSLVTMGFLISEAYPWLGYSPDGFIFKNGKPHALLEIKCPFLGKSYSHDDENFLKSCDFLKFEADQMPKMKEKHKYYGQVQLGMGIAGVKCTHLIIYSSFSDSFLEIVVDFNESFFRDLIRNTCEKYLKHVLHEYCKNKNSFC